MFFYYQIPNSYISVGVCYSKSLLNFQIKLVIDVTPIVILFDLSVSLAVSSQEILALNNQPTVLTPEQSGQLYVLLFLRESLTVL